MLVAAIRSLLRFGRTQSNRAYEARGVSGWPALTTDEHENTVLIFIERAALISLHGVGDAVVVRPQFVIGGHTRMIWCGAPTGLCLRPAGVARG